MKGTSELDSVYEQKITSSTEAYESFFLMALHRINDK